MADILDIMDRGGSVMWLLVASSVVISTALVYRFLCLRDHRFTTGTALERAGAAMCQGVSAGAAGLGGLQALILQRVAASPPASRAGDLQLAIAESQRQLAPPRDFIRALIHSAPLLGLLGTVGGMIEIFMVIAQAGASEPGMLAGGIGKALLTTQAGLLIVVVGVCGEIHLSRREQDLLDKLEETRFVLSRCIREAHATAS
ncbi:MAG: MotA/TolQ/ExbB proton channel family protein [Lentisphaeria bacterium]|jgi:biopolymer transport protein ExbB|nr:MotA/TolQ/ExbB proton channel family protein [Lentisphaeria bacterium]MDP7742438.1 MotA/TolQ/ExbB proton channel family protein [Lentisphaeria bacterium]